MKMIKAVLFGVVCFSVLFAGNLTVQAATGQIVPKTKHYSKATYHKGRWVTVTTYKHGKKTTKKVWRKSKHYGHKVAGKTHDVIMGPKKKIP